MFYSLHIEEVGNRGRGANVNVFSNSEGNAHLLRLVSGGFDSCSFTLCIYFFLKHSLLRGILNFFVKFSLETLWILENVRR